MVNNNLVGGDWNNVLSFNDFPYLGNNGMSSSQLTNSIIFLRGVGIPPTSCVLVKW